MRYVLWRDDDANALTPASCLDQLYRPFLQRGWPVNLALIPNVRTDVTYGAGIPEGFLVAKNGRSAPLAPICQAAELVDYLKANPSYAIAQHGCRHEFVRGQCEFDHDDRADLARRFDEGRDCLRAAGFPDPAAFVAPYDRLTRAGYRAAARRYRVISTGWFEWARLPLSWWPINLWRRLRRRAHWQVGRTILLSHPGCHLSCHRPLETMLERVRASLARSKLTVLVTHWWEFFPENKPNQPFIDVLHAAAGLLEKEGVAPIRFADLAEGKITDWNARWRPASTL